MDYIYLVSVDYTEPYEPPCIEDVAAFGSREEANSFLLAGECPVGAFVSQVKFNPAFQVTRVLHRVFVCNKTEEEGLKVELTNETQICGDEGQSCRFVSGRNQFHPFLGWIYIPVSVEESEAIAMASDIYLAALSEFVAFTVCGEVFDTLEEARNASKDKGADIRAFYPHMWDAENNCPQSWCKYTGFVRIDS